MSRQGSRGRAALVGLVVAAVGVLGWFLARGWYLDDYCFRRAPVPPGATESSSVQGPSLASPVSLRCDWAAHPDVVVVDPVPVLALLFVLLVALVAALVVLVRGQRGTSD